MPLLLRTVVDMLHAYDIIEMSSSEIPVDRYLLVTSHTVHNPGRTATVHLDVVKDNNSEDEVNFIGQGLSCRCHLL